MAEGGRLRVPDLERRQLASRAPTGDPVGADVAKGSAALPGGTGVGSSGTAVDVSVACPVLTYSQSSNPNSPHLRVVRVHERR
ncbi:hypothetical protein ACIF6I_24080 [Streptomyces microflavus]|uniref:hypothetical protein n=1 Tax=Streptomyces microflavus TaxID=1919 RepID=UPI0034417AC9